MGERVVRLLADLPDVELTRLTSGDRSAGRTLAELWQLPEPPPERFAATVLAKAGASALDRAGVRLVFGGLPTGVAGALETECARRGIAVFSNAADHRIDPHVPL